MSDDRMGWLFPEQPTTLMVAMVLLGEKTAKLDRLVTAAKAAIKRMETYAEMNDRIYGDARSLSTLEFHDDLPPELVALREAVAAADGGT